ncbi:hypothetical protein ACFQPF_03600 [Fictibacillus iocasae]|uniref:Uncharacterized protein n=1 Tax=Fictibacillus iocasae TaxID=2715437 RepID=A0ABW2NN66_9BACL
MGKFLLNFIGPVFRQVPANNPFCDIIYYQCTNCNVFFKKTQKQIKKFLCKRCNTNRRIERLVAIALKKINHRYYTKSEYTTSNCKLIGKLRYDYVLFFNAFFESLTPSYNVPFIFIEVLEYNHAYDESSIKQLITNTLKLKYAMSCNAPIIYFKELSPYPKKEESIIEDAIRQFNVDFLKAEQINNLKGDRYSFLLESFYKKSDYYRNLCILEELIELYHKFGEKVPEDLFEKVKSKRPQT